MDCTPPPPHPILRTRVQKSTLLLQNRGHADVLKTKDPFFREIRNAGAAPLCTWVPPPPPRAFWLDRVSMGRVGHLWKTMLCYPIQHTFYLKVLQLSLFIIFSQTAYILHLCLGLALGIELSTWMWVHISFLRFYGNTSYEIKHKIHHTFMKLSNISWTKIMKIYTCGCSS